MPLFQRRELDTAPFVRQAVSADYAGRLAYIGRRLDEDNCRAIAVIEISDNYIIRATGNSDGMPILTELVTEDFERGDVRPPLGPQSASYESILETIGKQLDQRVAANIAIIECASCYQVVGWQRGHAGGQLAFVPFEATYDHHALERLAAENG